MIRKTIATITAAVMVVVAMPAGSAADAQPERSPFISGDLPDDVSLEEWSATPHELDPNMQPIPYSRLVVEALTGRILEWEDLGATYTEVRLRGVEPNDGGYQMYDAAGWHFARDFHANPGGDVVFPWVRLTAGTWEIARTVSDTEEIVLAQFEKPSASGILGNAVAAILPAHAGLFGASYSTKPQSRTSCYSSCGYTPPPCGFYISDRAYEDKLVPLAILHSPYGGSSTQTTEFVHNRVHVWGWYGVDSTVTEGFGLTSQTGRTSGMFKWAQFYSYRWGDTCSGDTGTVAYITYWYPGYAPADLWGNDLRTDADDTTQISGSVRFDHRYFSRDTPLDGTRSTQEWHAYTEVSEVTRYAGSVTLYGNKYVSLGISTEIADGATQRYTYTFPADAGYDFWWGDNVRFGGQVWAFCRDGVGVSC